MVVGFTTTGLWFSPGTASNLKLKEIKCFFKIDLSGSLDKFQNLAHDHKPYASKIKTQKLK
jgi:hypothetical protein